VNVGTSREIEVDTVVFCIGDKVDVTMGLPLDKWKEFAKNPNPEFPIDDKSYEAYDSESEESVEGLFLAGWSREASTGLVGSARKDGTNGAKAVMEYLEKSGKGQSDAIQKLDTRLAKIQKPIVRNKDVRQLEAIELAQAEEKGLEEFKYASNSAMLAAMDLEQVTEKA
jgi:ferredoxin--NADP+ reductase